MSLFSTKIPFVIIKTTVSSTQSFRKLLTTPYYGAQVSFKLADIGEGIREVSVKEWFVKVGDKVSQFDEICEVQSDKASVTITSRFDGVITKLHHKVDDMALVGQALVDIETETDQIAEEKTEQSQPVEKAVKLPEIVVTALDKSNEEILCIPSVRRLAKEHKIDLSQIKGTGKQGRIQKEDVLKYLDSNHEEPAVALTKNDLQDRTEPIKGFQKAMVKTMTESLKIPHFVYSDDIKVTELNKLRILLKTNPDTSELKISMMPFLIKATANALQRYPILNAIVDGKCENVTYKSAINIGVAMDTKLGLAVPVIKNADQLGVVEINRELHRLAQSGKNGAFSTSDVTGGTFTISNIGMIGGTYLKPVILEPQVAIIAFGAIQRLPRFDRNDQIVAEEVINISASGDHRIIDGATMARFTQLLKKQIENPYLLFLNL